MKPQIPVMSVWLVKDGRSGCFIQYSIQREYIEIGCVKVETDVQGLKNEGKHTYHNCDAP